MARQLRVQYPGATYHVMNRADRREAIFVDDADRRLTPRRVKPAHREELFPWQLSPFVVYEWMQQPAWSEVERQAELGL